MAIVIWSHHTCSAKQLVSLLVKLLRVTCSPFSLGSIILVGRTSTWLCRSPGGLTFFCLLLANTMSSAYKAWCRVNYPKHCLIYHMLMYMLCSVSYGFSIHFHLKHSSIEVLSTFLLYSTLCLCLAYGTKQYVYYILIFWIKQ